MFSFRPLVASCLLLILAACGEAPPQGWNANLDVSCKPQDPVDKISSILSPEKFWRIAEYDMASMLAAGRKNLELSSSILEDSQAQRGQYFSRAEQAASDLGLTGKARRDHVKENMDRYEAEVKDIAERLERQEQAISWINRCNDVVLSELRSLGLQPVPYDPSTRPR